MRSHQPVKPGLIDLDVTCPKCKRGLVQHIDGRSWRLKEPLPHYLCFNCLHEFHIPLPRVPVLFKLWRSA
jgi:hypothetical protein